MCEQRDGFKLCTCDEDLADPDWVLERRDASLPHQVLVGRAVPPRFSNDELALQREILVALAAGDCFDFEFEPRQDDVLALRLGETRLRFRFGEGRWSIDPSTMLAGWRRQMVRRRWGTIDHESAAPDPGSKR